MSLKKILTFFFGMGALSSIAYSTPSVEIIQSCKNSVAANSTITMTPLPPPVAKETPDTNCESQYETPFDNKNYGHVECNDEPYLIVDNSKIKLNTATNLSVNPSVGPNNFLLSTTELWKIDMGTDSYLCVNSALSHSGTASHAEQYYIVEHAFDTGTPKLYFYFFDRDIAPLFP